MIRIVFMGTPDFAVPPLQKLIERFEVVGVVTQPDRPAGRGQALRPSPVKVVAENAGIPLYQPESLKAPESAQLIRDWQPEVIVVAAFGQILRQHTLDIALPINIHASLLPRWRGASPIQHAILAGDAESGVSLMQMERGLDSGPVFGQRAIPLQPGETAQTLHNRLAELGAALIAEHLEDILAGKMPAQPQDESQVTYAPLISKSDGALDWQQPAAALERRLRAMTPWPGVFTRWQGKLLKILEARPLELAPRGQPGLVVEQQGQIIVLTGDGGLALECVQLAGKTATPIADFVRGRPDFPGSHLPD